jgi:sugar/nucleoside kinase (ribokinase family)
MADIVGIGAAVYDILLMVDGYPVEDTKQRALSSKIQGGGPCATALVAAAKLGVSAEYLGIVGGDNYGLYILEEFKRYGVVADSVRILPGCQSPCTVVLCNKQNSKRTCIGLQNNLPKLKPEDIPLDRVFKAKILHVDGTQNEATVYAAQKARERGIKVSIDAGSPSPGIERLLPLVDIFIPPEAFVCKFTGKSTAEEGAPLLYEHFKQEILVVTQGARGGFLFDGKKIIPYKPFPIEKVEQVIDTNGAGDVFHGAFDVALLRGMGPIDAADFASAVAAIKSTRFGAREGVPSYEETIRIIEKYNIEGFFA